MRFEEKPFYDSILTRNSSCLEIWTDRVRMASQLVRGGISVKTYERVVKAGGHVWSVKCGVARYNVKKAGSGKL